jgi:CHAD domain-containing protein
MAYRLKKKESASAGIRRIAREEIDDALELLEDDNAEPSSTVHELRKKLKKLRAVVRLVRDELGDEVYRRDGGALRDLGRRLSPARDAAIRVSALDGLREAYRRDFPADDMTPVRKRLVARHLAEVRRLRRGSTLSAIARELRDLRRRVRAWPLTKDGFRGLEPGLRRSYRAGRRGEGRAYASASDEAFHDWRKRAKDLRYHVQVLESVWPKVLRDVESELHDLTDRLGDDHDLGELRAVLTKSHGSRPGKKGLARVIDLIGRRRSELRAEARPIGARVYAEAPKVFSKRIRSYWDAWRSGSA